MRDAGEIYTLWDLFGRTRHLGYRLRQKELQPYGITPRQAAMLRVISSLGKKAIPAEISRWLGREGHTVSSNLNAMERRGLIKKTKDLEKKNLVRIALTNKGRQAWRHALKHKSMDTLFSVLTDKERRELRSILLKMQERAEKELGLKHTPASPKF